MRTNAAAFAYSGFNFGCRTGVVSVAHGGATTRAATGLSASTPAQARKASGTQNGSGYFIVAGVSQ